jgi:hypothetical protein
LDDGDIPAKIAAPARRALDAAGYKSLAQVAKATERQLLALHGMGPRAIRQLREALAERGLHLKGD